MARHSFDTLDLSFEEYQEHLNIRRLQPTAVISSQFRAIQKESGAQFSVPADWTLILQKYVPETGRVEFRQHQSPTVFEASAADVTSSTHPTPDVLAQIYSGNSHFCAITKAKLGASKAAGPKATVEDVEFQVLEVRAADTQTHLLGIEGGLVSLSGGESFDVGAAINMGDFVVIRKTRKEEHAVVKIEDLDTFSSILTDDTGVLAIRPGSCDLFSPTLPVQELHLVCHDSYACGSRGMKLPLKKGDKVLVHDRSNDAMWVRDTKGRFGVLTAETAASNLMDLGVENQVLSRAYGHGIPATWKTHTLHNDRIIREDETTSRLEETALRLTRSCNTEFPLPPLDWTPPHHRLPDGSNSFGHWEFASDDDRHRAQSLNLRSAATMVFAASMGWPGLAGIDIIWVPGMIEGSQGAGFGPCSPYIHVYLINFRRKWAFGQQPVPLGELPVYTGSDEFWFEAKGADASYLDSYKTQPSTSTTPTEQEIFEEARKRQGFATRQLSTPPDILKANPTSNNAVQWKTVILQASNRSVEMGRPLANEHPIDPDQSLDLRTSFHPQLADCGYHVKMPDCNYLLEELKLVQKDLFKSGKKALSVVQAGLPMLNADGESTTTIVMGQTKQVFEVQLIDIPCLPKAIAADENFAMLEAFHRLTKSWQQIGGRMNEKQRNYTNAYNSEVWKIGHTYRLLDKQALGKEQLNNDEKARFLASVAARPITQAHRNLNTLRGCAPGKIDPAQGLNAVVMDPAGNQVANWVDYPDCDPNPTERLHRHHTRAEASVLKERSKLVKKQAEAQGQATQGDDDSGDDDDGGDEGEDEQD